MGDHLAKAEDFEKKADKKLKGWGIFGFKYEGAANLFDEARYHFVLAKAWDQAGAAYVKLARCHLKLNNKFEAATSYADAAHCYKKSNIIGESLSCLEKSANIFLDIGKDSMSARYYKEMAELHEHEKNLDQAIVYYERAADLFESEEVTTSAHQCKQKIAEFAAQLEQYQKSVDIYEEIARQSLNNDLLKYGVKRHLLNAGICELCKGDVVAIKNALRRYQELDPTFSGTGEYKLLSNLAAAIDEEDVAKFTDASKKFDHIVHLDALKMRLLLKIKDALKAKEME